MKKLILLALAAVMMAGCDTSSIEKPTEKVDGVTVTIIDSCEYIRFASYAAWGYSHKGNCRFCHERRQQELEELVKRIKGE